MTVQQNIKFMENAAEAKVSNEFSNQKSESLYLEVSGDATSFKASVECKLDINSDSWVKIAGIDLSDFTIVDEGIMATSIYMFVIECGQKFRVNLESVDGGSVTIFGRLCLEE